jgi:hypothetical protein
MKTKLCHAYRKLSTSYRLLLLTGKIIENVAKGATELTYFQPKYFVLYGNLFLSIYVGDLAIPYECGMYWDVLPLSLPHIKHEPKLTPST